MPRPTPSSLACPAAITRTRSPSIPRRAWPSCRFRLRQPLRDVRHAQPMASTTQALRCLQFVESLPRKIEPNPSSDRLAARPSLDAHASLLNFRAATAAGRYHDSIIVHVKTPPVQDRISEEITFRKLEVF